MLMNCNCVTYAHTRYIKSPIAPLSSNLGNVLKFWKIEIRGKTLLVIKFGARNTVRRGVSREVNFKISNEKVGLEINHWNFFFQHNEFEISTLVKKTFGLVDTGYEGESLGELHH